MSRARDTAALLLLGLLLLGAVKRTPVRKKAPGKGSTPGAPGSARERWDPLGVKPKTAAAIASGDPKRMRELAKLLRAEGYVEEAAELEAAAAAVRR